jgi:signal transduction histidine kinase
MAFERFEHEATYYRASAFLERVVAKHPDMFDMQERFPDEFADFFRSLVLFEPDSQLYLLDSAGTVIVSTGEAKLPLGFKVALKPVMESSGPEPMPYVLGDDPERMDSTAVIAARAVQRNVILKNPESDGYLYLVCHKRVLPQGGFAVFQSSFAKPTLWLLCIVIAVSTLCAAWVTFAVTRPLAKLTEAMCKVSRRGLQDFASGDNSYQTELLDAMPRTSKDEIGQLSKGLRAMLDTLRTQWAALRRLDHFRREGVSNLSHDLRSPLTATVACLETLENRWAGDDTRVQDRRLIEVALRNTHNAARLVQSLGDLAQLDEPQFQLRTDLMDVNELLDDLVLRFAERAQQREVSLLACEASETALLVAVDVELFERALANLVDNALKFCPQGATITLGALAHEAQVWVQVKDNGPGIPPEDLPHLFDRFYQSRQNVAPATGEGGKGLGLAIVKRIVELHGGEVMVQNLVPSGTCVTLALPSPSVAPAEP